MSHRQKVFLDANVIFTAVWNPNGISRKIIERNDAFFVMTCELAVEEARRNLLAKKPKSINDLLQILKHIKILPTILHGGPVNLNTKDKPIFFSAKAGRADVIITGDKGFSKIDEEEAGLLILSPREFYERFIKEAGV